MSKKVQRIPSDVGLHNLDLEASRRRLASGGTYKDASTICVIPFRGSENSPDALIHGKVALSWMNLMTPMNQRFFRLPIYDMEVGAAYTAAVELILGNPELSKWKYMLTMETDNIPPPDGLLKLIESIETDSKLAAVSGLYFCKGPGGASMVYGDPNSIPTNCIPQIPLVDQLQYCVGIGMGFGLFRIKVFKDERIPRPWFRTVQDYTQNVGARVLTQDLFFCTNAFGLGWKFAVDTRVKVGHLDYASPDAMVW